MDVKLQLKLRAYSNKGEGSHYPHRMGKTEMKNANDAIVVDCKGESLMNEKNIQKTLFFQNFL